MALNDFYKAISTPSNVPKPSSQSQRERLQEVVNPKPTTGALMNPVSRGGSGRSRSRDRDTSSQNVELDEPVAETIQAKAVQGEQLRGSILLRDGQKTAGDIYREYGYNRGGSIYNPAPTQRYDIREDYSPATKVIIAQENIQPVSYTERREIASPGSAEAQRRKEILSALEASKTGYEVPGGAQGIFTRAGMTFDKVTETVDRNLPTEEAFQRFRTSKVGNILYGQEEIGERIPYERKNVIDVGSYFVPYYGQVKFATDIGREAEAGRYGTAVALASIPYVAKFGTPVIINAVKNDVLKTVLKQQIDILKTKNFQGLGISKQGKVRLSKAEIRFKTRTGFTKSEIRKGTKPSQAGTKTTTFYNKDIKQNTFLQTKLAGQDYKTLEQYKSFSLVKQPNKIVNNQFIQGQETLFGKTKTRRGLTINSKDLAPQSVSFQKTTKNIDVGLSNSDLTLSAKTKLKIKYVYDPLTKKPKLTPKPILNVRPNPSQSQTITLVTNVNKAGKEIYAPVNEPLRIIGGNRGGGRIRAELIAKAQAKRNAQIRIIDAEKELARQRNTLPSVTSTRQVYTYGTNPSQPKSIEEAFRLVDPLKKKKLTRFTPTIEIDYTGKTLPSLVDVRPAVLRLPGSQLPVITPPQIQSPQKITLPSPKAELTNNLVLSTGALLKLRQEQKYQPELIKTFELSLANKLKAENVLSLKAYQVPALAQQPAQALATSALSQQQISSGTKQKTIPEITPISITRPVNEPRIIPRPFKFEIPKKLPEPKYPDRFVPREPIKKVPVTKVPKIDLPNKKVDSEDEFLKNKSLGFGFQAFLKRKGKFFAVSPVLKSKLSALDIGTLKAKQTLGATFKVERVKGKPLDIRTSGEFSRFRSEFRDYAIRGTNNIPLTDTYIQKSRYRLGTRSEVSEIQRAKKNNKSQRWF